MLLQNTVFSNLQTLKVNTELTAIVIGVACGKSFKIWKTVLIMLMLTANWQNDVTNTADIRDGKETY